MSIKPSIYKRMKLVFLCLLVNAVVANGERVASEGFVAQDLASENLAVDVDRHLATRTKAKRARKKSNFAGARKHCSLCDALLSVTKTCVDRGPASLYLKKTKCSQKLGICTGNLNHFIGDFTAGRRKELYKRLTSRTNAALMKYLSYSCFAQTNSTIVTPPAQLDSSPGESLFRPLDSLSTQAPTGVSGAPSAWHPTTKAPTKRPTKAPTKAPQKPTKRPTRGMYTYISMYIVMAIITFDSSFRLIRCLFSPFAAPTKKPTTMKPTKKPTNRM